MSAPRACGLYNPEPLMQTITKPGQGSHGGHYHMTTTTDENMNWMKLTHLLLNFLLTIGPPFVHLPLLQNSW